MTRMVPLDTKTISSNTSATPTSSSAASLAAEAQRHRCAGPHIETVSTRACNTCGGGATLIGCSSHWGCASDTTTFVSCCGSTARNCGALAPTAAAITVTCQLAALATACSVAVTGAVVVKCAATAHMAVTTTSRRPCNHWRRRCPHMQ